MRRWPALLLLLFLAPARADKPGAPGAGATVTVDFDAEAPGGPPSQFDPVIGDWSIGEVEQARGLLVDGSRWRQGTPSANLADQARRLYGERYAEFLDGVKAFAFFPLAVYRGDCPGDDKVLSVRFYPIAGRIDQAAGIAFGIGPDGSYLGARANALEDNLLFFKVVRGKRTLLNTVRGVHTPTRTWHTLKVSLKGKDMSVELDGQERLHRQLDSVPTGRCGLWSKADSKVLFDDFSITPRASAPEHGP
ncbi:MAG TPA: hypothetical protein VH877_20320 [Polyangia bacterium]|nr:hypothetical protein [Polyangia bacterium]